MEEYQKQLIWKYTKNYPPTRLDTIVNTPTSPTNFPDNPQFHPDGARLSYNENGKFGLFPSKP